MREELYATLTAVQTVNATIAIAKGDKGDKGEKGEGYTLTESDKTEISALVINKLPYTIGVDSEGYIGVTYNGE